MEQRKEGVDKCAGALIGALTPQLPPKDTSLPWKDVPTPPAGTCLTQIPQAWLQA